MNENRGGERGEVRELTTSNAMHLTVREWLILGVFAVLLFAFTPVWWARAEKLAPEADYRMPYEISNDYWLFARWVEGAVERHEVVLVGDSVIWGQYVTRQQTLSHYLNEAAGRERFGNLGLDGTHPLALEGLVRNYGTSIAGKDVILHCNPLWMSSEKHDLQTTEEFAFNHPQLVPQFSPRIPCYSEEVSRRLGIAVTRNVPFCGWTSHLQLAYFDKKDIPGWTLEHPYQSPLKAVTFALPPSDNKLRHEPVPWTTKGITPVDFPWVRLETSLQWQAFRRTVALLQARGNRVSVMVGPFNEHLLTEGSRERYTELKRGIETWLGENNIPSFVPAVLPSELYADASHPLSEGYAQLAKLLLAVPGFDGGSRRAVP